MKKDSFLHKFPFQQRLRGRLSTNCHVRQQLFQHSKLTLFWQQNPSCCSEQFFNSGGTKTVVIIEWKKCRSASAAFSCCIFHTCNCNSATLNKQLSERQKNPHTHTNNIRCPPLILLIIPTACVCVVVCATACLTFLLVPQTAVICVAPSAQAHFVIRPICVLLHCSVLCVSVCASARSPFQSTSQQLCPLPMTPPPPSLQYARTCKRGGPQPRPLTMAPEHKPWSKTADTEKALLVLRSGGERRASAAPGSHLNTVCHRRPGVGEPKPLLLLRARGPVERRSGSGRFMQINFRVSQAAVNSNASLSGLALFSRPRLPSLKKLSSRIGRWGGGT